MKICQSCLRPFESQSWSCPACGATPQSRNGVHLLAPELAEGDGLDADYAYDALARDEGGHFWFRERNRLLVWALRRHFPGASSFLEIGCGTGFVISGIREANPGLSLSASELRADGLTFAKRRLPNVDLLQLDARRLPFHGEFDVIGAFDVLEHIDEDQAVLESAWRALRPGGGILLTVPQHPFLWSVTDDFSRHRRRYTRRELVAKTRNAGFEIQRVTSFCAFLLPALAWLRLTRRQQRLEHFDPAAELRIHPLLNWLFEKVMANERRLIRAGVSLPAGGSLLLVARRGGRT